MALGPRLDLRQTQSLVMTPQLQQAIKLLALSNLELETFIGEALEANPLLDIGEAAGGDVPDLPMIAGSVIIVGAGLYTLWREHRLARAGRPLIVAPASIDSATGA